MWKWWTMGGAGRSGMVGLEDVGVDRYEVFEKGEQMGGEKIASREAVFFRSSILA